MIGPTSSLLINPTNTLDWLKGTGSEATVDQDFQQILQETAAKEQERTATETAAGTAAANSRAGLVSLLHELAGSANPASVNEEQLFASIIYDRIAATKGEAAAKQYDALLDDKLLDYTRPDGAIYIEDAARAALREMESSGLLTTEEAETIHAQAFQAAQLDDNTAALYDSRGTTMSVAPTATAMEKVLAMLLKFDSGELPSSRMSLSYVQDQPAGSTAATGSTTSSATSGVAASGTDSTSGYSNSAEYGYYNIGDGGRRAWRIPESGPEYGKQLKIVFADGHTVHVKDTSQRYSEKDGFVFRPGLGEKGDKNSNTWTSHNGVYLYAPFNNQSTSVKFYWS